MRAAPWKHVTKEQVEAALGQFRGDIMQAPPMYVSSIKAHDVGVDMVVCRSFSALKMDGKPLYEYARNGIPLPRPIEKRPVTIHSLEIAEWLGSDHKFRWPEKKFTEDQKQAFERALSGVEENAVIKDEPEPEQTLDVPTAFVLRMKVSGGTYVRSIVHDLAHAVGSAGHVVTLTRSRQGRYALEPEEQNDMGCVPWEVFTKATESLGEPDEEGWVEWEREVADRLEIVGDK